MLSALPLNINLKPSNDFRRLIVLVYGLVFYVLWCAEWLYLLWFGVVMLSVFLVPLWRWGRPSSYVLIVQQTNHWFAFDKKQQTTTLKTVRMVFDAGFFILVALETSSRWKIIMVFKDQLPQADLKQWILIDCISCAKLKAHEK